MTYTTIYHADTWLLMSDEERCTFKDWLTENGINPNTIPLSEDIIIEDNAIHYWGMTIEKQTGNIMQVKATLDENGERAAVLEERSAPLKTPPPPTPNIPDA